MTEPKKSDHWESLASELGAKAPADESQNVPAPSTQPTAPASEASAEKAKAKTRAKPHSAAPHRPADWDIVASQLGLTPKVEPVEKVSQAKTLGEPSVAETRIAEVKSVQRPKAAPRRAEDAEPFAAEVPAITEEPADVRELPFGVFDEPSGPAVEEEAESAETDSEAKRAKSGRRRRKRRRKAPLPGESTAEQTPAAVPAEVEPGLTGDQLTTVYEVTEAVAEPVPGVSEREPSGERVKRRRKRRGKKRKEGDEAASTEDVAAKTPREISDARQRAGEEPESELDDEEAEASSESAKTIHRGIPTWEETIDLIVSQNLDARAKKGGGSSRGRNGGQGGGKARAASKSQPSGRGRANRSKSSKKRS